MRRRRWRRKYGERWRRREEGRLLLLLLLRPGRLLGSWVVGRCVGLVGRLRWRVALRMLLSNGRKRCARHGISRGSEEIGRASCRERVS